MRFILALLLLAATSPATAACFHYGAAPVTVSGKIFQRTDSGPPEAKTRRKAAARESHLYITLDTPLCVDAGQGAHQDDPAEKGVSSMQMIYPEGKNGFRKTWLDRRVVVSGTLLHASTTHHHTRVLIAARATRPDRKRR